MESTFISALRQLTADARKEELDEDREAIVSHALFEICEEAKEMAELGHDSIDVFARDIMDNTTDDTDLLFGYILARVKHIFKGGTVKIIRVPSSTLAKSSYLTGLRIRW